MNVYPKTRPVLIEIEDYFALPETGKVAVEALAQTHGVPMMGITRIVIGVRSIWFWVLLRDDKGQFYLADRSVPYEEQEVAYECVRFALDDDH